MNHASRHWYAQRLTAIANASLMLWLVWSVVHMIPMSYVDFSLWLVKPLHAVLMISALGSVFWHAALGTQVIAEDYIHDQNTLKMTLAALRLYFAGAALVGILSVIRIAWG